MASKMELTYDAAKGPFCCGHDGHGKIKYDIRASGVLLPDEFYQQIHEFMAAVNAGLIGNSLDSLSDAQLKDIKTIIRLNVTENHEDRYTVLFVLTSELSSDFTTKIASFAKLDSPQYFDNIGTHSYLAYHCAIHKKSFRIGIDAIRWNKKKTWATFENTKIDDLIGHPKKPVNKFGQDPITF